ncbi:hypothetical protein ABZ770_03490 [Streptomyces sp. NPDC006654]|uniref:hypothetical protein n=1 Tax=Streptomyces sp. NPDC006654 TaxID=3156897 RepID=UPI0033D3B7E4
MTPRLRTAFGGLLLLVLATILLPSRTAVAHGPGPLPSASAGASAGASATPRPSLAGTVAGEGRTRPGRHLGPAVTVMGDDDPDDPDEGAATEPAENGAESQAATAAQPPRDAAVNPTAPQPPPVHQAIAPGQDGETEPVLDILPLGSGLVLVGLGLGLAFIGLRVRRG